MDRLDRRRFLAQVGMLVAAGVALDALPPWARHAWSAAGPVPDLIERNDWPEHWETTLAALGRDFATSNDRFFVRSHFGAPDIDPATWRLEVSGQVDTPLSLSLADMQAMKPVRATVTLECAGNGRGLFQLPSTSGTQWAYGAVGTAEWSGVTLQDVLRRAGLKPEGQHVWFECADHATLVTAPSFTRSLPLIKAMNDVVLATRMNNAPLPKLHGAPLRAVVPGWYGMASAKWVTRIRVETEPSDNHFMAKGYHYNYPGDDPVSAPPVDVMRVKSLITRPLELAKVPRGGVVVEGVAWSGSSRVARVEVSIDAGVTWKDADPSSVRYPSAWLAWDAQYDLRARAHLTIMARATDGDGNVQPIAARANAGGYANNSIHTVRADVV